jgi:hypothetical protein
VAALATELLIRHVGLMRKHDLANLTLRNVRIGIIARMTIRALVTELFLMTALAVLVSADEMIA